MGNPLLDAPVVEADLIKKINEESGAKVWTTTTDYRINQFTVFAQILYRCIVNHKSDDFAVDFAANFWEDITGGVGAGTFLHGEVTTHASLPSAAANPGKRYFVNTTTGIIGFRNLNGIYRSDGATWIYQGYDRDANSVKTRYESNADTNAYTDSEKTAVANSITHQADSGDPHSTLPLTTKGDLVTRNASDPVRLPVGTNGQILLADSTQASGLKWSSSGGFQVVSIQGGVSSVGGNSTKLMSHGQNAADAPIVFCKSGRIVGISIAIDSTQSGGTCEAQILLNGVAQTGVGETTVIDGVDQVTNFQNLATPIVFNAGDTISAQTVTSGFAPTGSNATISVWAEISP